MSLSVVGAFLRAILAWMFLYVALAHLFVYWNWNATDGTHEPSNNEAQQQESQLLLSLFAKMDETERQALLAETPLEPVTLTLLNDDHVPDAIPLVSDDILYQERIQDLKNNAGRLESEVAALEAELEEWKDQKIALEQATSELQDMKQKVEQKRMDPAGVWNVVEATMDRYEEDTKVDLWSVDGSRPSEAAQVWQEVMENITDLSLLTDEELDRIMDHLVTTLDVQIEYATDVAWKPLIQAVERSDYPTKQTSPVNVHRCPIFPILANTTTTTDDDDEDNAEEEEEEDNVVPPTKDHALERMVELRNMWSVAYEDHEVPLVLGPGQNRLAVLRNKLLLQWTSKARTHVEKSIQEAKLAASEQYSNEACLKSTDQASYILEAGLLAMERQNYEDVNTVILNALVDLGFDVRRIILDAVLLEGTSSNTGGSLTSSSSLWAQQQDTADDNNSNNLVPLLTWRQVLDQPLTKEFIKSWLPLLVDAIGGYNDALDSWLDQILPQHPTQQHDDEVEEDDTNDNADNDNNENDVVLKRLLDLAGKHPLPPWFRNFWLYSQRQHTPRPKHVVTRRRQQQRRY